MKDSDGDILQATNAEAQKAMRLFLETEGVDIHPAAAVSVASLIKEVQLGHIERDATIMLNITGGGEARYRADKRIFYLKPNYVFPLTPDENDVVVKVEELFA